MDVITQAEYDNKRAKWITQTQFEQYKTKWRAEQKLHERKLSKLSQVDKQFYVTVAYLLEIAARGAELFLEAEPAESMS